MVHVFLAVCPPALSVYKHMHMLIILCTALKKCVKYTGVYTLEPLLSTFCIHISTTHSSCKHGLNLIKLI